MKILLPAWRELLTVQNRGK